LARLFHSLTAAATVRVLVLDVDGVLTDGSIQIDDLGHETKRFNVRDGLGIKLWQKLGLEVAIITGRSGRAVQHRSTELGITNLVQGSGDKLAALQSMIGTLGVRLDQVATLGDDWPELEMMRHVGYPMAVADADAHVRAAAAFVTAKPGGHGAVREAIEHLLSARGLLDKALRLYDSSHAAE
jgi:3-deoxy-D-manno-octulosonate 8-phosphate phosphatase (KDO 8-P phosphatase)